MKTRLSFETLENKTALTAVGFLHNCLWKEHDNQVVHINHRTIQKDQNIAINSCAILVDHNNITHYPVPDPVSGITSCAIIVIPSQQSQSHNNKIVHMSPARKPTCFSGWEELPLTPKLFFNFSSQSYYIRLYENFANLQTQDNKYSSQVC